MKSFKNFNEAVKGQDTESRKEGAKERAADKKSGKIRKNTLDSKDYATQQKKSIEWHDKRTKGRYTPGQVSDVHEVAPPGWGHTKAEKEKTDPSKPKSKIGGTAAAFKRALDRGDFKGLPGDKTKKEKTASMFKLMWSMKKKGDKPHYKPGTDKKYKKYQEEDKKDVRLKKEGQSSFSDKSNTFTQESLGFTIDSGEHKKASKKAKLRNLAKGNTNPNEKAAAEKKAGGPKLIGEEECQCDCGQDPCIECGESHHNIKEGISTSDAKRLQKASVLSFSNDPKSVDRARARQVEVDYKDLMKQQAAKKKKKIKEEKMTPMQDNNLFGNAYAGLKKQKKKAIESIPDKKSEEYRRNLQHKSPTDPRESVEILHGADGKVAHEIIDIIKPEPMKVPESPMKWKELVEKIKLPAVNGSIIDVYLTWRGKGISIKLFFPQSRTRRPTREEVNSQIQKVYPGAKIGNFVESDPQPGEPFLQVGD
jgi:hypothetical protein